jgi:hypothetical protein
MFKVEFGGVLIESFFNELTKERIDYIVLRNHEGLPQINSSKDVDILIDKKNLFITNKILIKLYQELEYNFIWENKLDYLTGYAFIKKIDNIIYSVKIDIFHGLKWRGLNYLDNNIIFNKKNEYHSLFIPNKSHESFIMIIYYILYAKSIKEKYFNNIYTYKNDIENFIRISSLALDNALSEKIVKVLENKNIPKLLSYRKEIIKNIFIKNLKYFPLLIKNVTNHLYCEVFKRNSFGTIVLFDKNCNEKDFITDIFIDLGIGYKVESQTKFTTFELLKILRKNPLIVLDKKDLSKFQKKIFSNRILNVKNSSLDTIFSNIQKSLKKDKI